MGSYASSITEQKDQRAVIEGMESGIITLPESAFASPSSIAAAGGSTVTKNVTVTSGSGSQISIGEYTPQVAQTIGDILNYSDTIYARLLGLSENAINGIFSFTESQQAANIAAQETTQQGLFGLTESMRQQTESLQTGLPLINRTMLYIGLGLAGLLILTKTKVLR